MKKTTLAIETSCDDTSLSIVRWDGETFHTDLILTYSQIQDHQKYGGVVPEVAYRLHSEKIIAILQTIGRDRIAEVDMISVTTHPGLPGSLLIGMTVAQMLGEYFQKSVVHVNHVLGHIFSIFLEQPVKQIRFPLIVLTASGGHNDLYLVTKKGEGMSLQDFHLEKLGQTLDDAAGECFDKVARMLGGPYPGGLRVSQQALKGSQNPLVHFKMPLVHDVWNFSFSGMKAQVHHLLEKFKKSEVVLDDQLIADVSRAFQETVVQLLVQKVRQASQYHQASSIALCGGVSANERLFEALQDMNKDQLLLLRPAKKVYCTDNAAMIGVVGLMMS